jgi:hypothetical protein
VSFPEVTAIGVGAFGGCTALEQVYFPKVQVVQGLGNPYGDRSGTGLKRIGMAEFPSATSIGYTAFTSCADLEVVDFPEITSIGDYAFSGTALRSANFPKVTSIGDGVFTSCTALQSVNIPNATSIGDYAFSGSALQSANFPEVTSISNSAFEYSSLQSANFPKATSIGNSAFSGCGDLRSVNLPVVEIIDYWAFSQIRSEGRILLTIILGPNAPSLGTNVFLNSIGLGYPSIVTVKIPAGAVGYDTAWQAAFKGERFLFDQFVIVTE